MAHANFVAIVYITHPSYGMLTGRIRPDFVTL